ncbi:hypothetical protein AMECASPLE_032431, partial [Ameca splendens]
DQTVLERVPSRDLVSTTTRGAVFQRKDNGTHHRGNVQFGGRTERAAPPNSYGGEIPQTTELRSEKKHIYGVVLELSGVLGNRCNLFH